jgi:2-methylisocitrate lyase-like PEP mutase family enzyme
MMDRARLRQLGAELRRLHDGPATLVLPNAWDAASARLVERAGFGAIATTSSGVNASLGYADGDVVPPDEMFAAVRRIAAAVGLPLTADLEGGYGLPAGELVERLLDAGGVGLNLEDTRRGGASGADPLIEPERQAERLAAVRAAADAAGVPIVLNARIDVFLRRSGPLAPMVEEALDRAHQYVAAGADCVFPIFIADDDAIARFVAEAGAPVNVLLRPGVPPLARLVQLGVRRVSLGGGLAKLAMIAAEAAVARLRDGDASAFETR